MMHTSSQTKNFDRHFQYLNKNLNIIVLKRYIYHSVEMSMSGANKQTTVSLRDCSITFRCSTQYVQRLTSIHIHSVFDLNALEQVG